MENPVYYVQYGARRGCRRLPGARPRPASSAGRFDAVDLAKLGHEREEELLPRRWALYPDVVTEATETRAPQKVSTWVRDFARAAFHGFYRDCRVITDDAELTQARLWADRGVPDRAWPTRWASFGVSAPEEMSRLDPG